MSLFRQLWLAILGLTIVIFIGSLLVSLLTARGYLEQQLSIKNNDNANALALALSQLPDKDPVSLELLISAQFDTGYYQQIRFTSTDHRVLVDKMFRGGDFGAPGWFVQLFPIRATPGVSHVQNGWRQLGTVAVISHSRFAYRELWKGALRLMEWLAAAGLIAGGIGTLLLRFITRPLGEVVGQAEAISERRFVTLSEPHTRELRSVVRAMNGMVARVKQMFSEEAARLDELRREINHDAVTGLPNRAQFVNALQAALSAEDAAADGVLILVRLTHLADINRQLGRSRADSLLKRLGATLNAFSAASAERAAARLNGGDFAVLLPGEEDATLWVKHVAEALSEALLSASPQVSDLFHAGAVHYRRGDAVGTLLATADEALAAAESRGPNAWHAATLQETPHAQSADAWRALLQSAIAERNLKLVFFPVRTTQGTMLHQESVVRLQAEQGGPWLVAGDFIPMATRLKLSSAIDLEVIRLALHRLSSDDTELAVNLSTETVADWGFRNALTQLIGDRPGACKKLWIEVSEYGAFRELEAFRELARTLKAAGCRVGIEHAGRRLSDFSQLSDIGIDYIKVDGGFIRDIAHNPGNQELLAGLCKMAHSMGILAIAEGVRSDEELKMLPHLGFDAMTGPAVPAS